MTTNQETTNQKQSAAKLLQMHKRRPTRIGLVSGGLGAYWPQFPELLPQLQESARYVTGRFQELDAEVIDAGFISDPQEAGPRPVDAHVAQHQRKTARG
jgi:L-arabinose isomerase